MEKNKKLIFFMPSMEGGGVEKNLVLIANFLVNHVKNIYLITFDKKFKKKFDRRIVIICPNKKGVYSKYYKYFLCLILLFKLLLIENKSLVFAFQANIYCIIISKLLRKKIIVRSNSAPEGWNKNKFKNFIFSYFFKQSDDIIVNSKDFKKKVDKKFGVKSTCIYNPLNKNEIKYKSKNKISKKIFKKKNSLKIINVARFTDQKNHLLLLNALNDIKNKLNFELLLIGYGPNKETLNKFVENNNLSKKVKILNFEDNPYKFIKLSDVFILTSNFEGLPNVILEALCLKKIVISTDCPTGPREILSNGKYGILFKMNDRINLSKIIIRVNQYKKRYQKIANNGFKSLDRFSFSKNMNKYLYLVNKNFQKI